MIEINLPWPDPALSPNARPHWSVKARAVRAARAEAKYALLAAANGQPLIVPDGGVDILVTFYPPDKRRRDRDNAQASLKAYQDGLADGLGVDDVHFRSQYRWEPAGPAPNTGRYAAGIKIVLSGVSICARSGKEV